MAPHADSSAPNGNGVRLYGSGIDALRGASRRYPFTRYDDNELHDLVCVGFGPASLAIAVALHDALEGQSISTPRVRFLESQHHFAWHAGMLLPGAKMQITFLKDLATLRNPRSHFTFINYLHENSRLVQFTNLGTFLPERIEYEDYMRWSAGHFENVVDYDHTATAIEAGKSTPGDGPYEFFTVKSWNRTLEKEATLRARHVVVAIGGQPRIPECLHIDSPRVLHSSQYATKIHELFPVDSSPKSVAVVGAGQSAAEIFYNISSRFPGAKAHLIMRDSALRPSDDSPFVNEIFDPERVSSVYEQQPAARQDSIAADKATNYGVVRLELLEQIYSTMYSYRLQYKSESDWPLQIHTHRSATGVTALPKGSQHALRLHVADTDPLLYGHSEARSETLDVDLVIAASGYSKDGHEALMKPLRPLMPDNKSLNGDADGVEPGAWNVNRDYSVQVKPGMVAKDAGIWLQGCNEATHGLSDTLLSILATRGGEIVQSVFKV